MEERQVQPVQRVQPIRTRRSAPPRLIVLLVVLVLLGLFIWRNDEDVEVQFLFFDVTTALAWVIGASALLGFLVGLVLPRFRR